MVGRFEEEKQTKYIETTCFTASVTENLLWNVERVVSNIFIPFLNSKVASKRRQIIFYLSGAQRKG